jgi:hypothetical protein
VELDDHGLSFLSTPFFAQEQDLHTAKEMLQDDHHMFKNPFLAFMAEWGLGQGESASSLMWTAMYDILLKWIDLKNRHLHSTETGLDFSDQDAQAAQMNAFADDLGTITAGKNAAAMQKIRASWILSFCTFTGLIMNPAKIKSTVVGPPLLAISE